MPTTSPTLAWRRREHRKRDHIHHNTRRRRPVLLLGRGLERVRSNTDEAMTRSEDHLRVDTMKVEAGRAWLQIRRH